MASGLVAGLLFLCSLGFFYFGLRFFQARPRHLRHLWKHPPIWLAWLLGIVFVAIIDLTAGFGPGFYPADCWDWIFFGGFPGIVAIGLTGFFAIETKPAEEKCMPERSHSLEDLSEAPWTEIEEWLQKDNLTNYDYLNHREIASRLHDMLASSTRSIGIVGRFGSGKSTIISWVECLERKRERDCNPKLTFVPCSCWGFEDSASAVHEFLTRALDQASKEVDTFRFRGLPERYRQAISVSGSWAEVLLHLFPTNRNPVEQIKGLSSLLHGLNSRMVFVVEDLDRNDSRNFDIQEVLGFLHQLKGCVESQLYFGGWP